MVTESEWEQRGFSKYGLIVVNADRQAAQVEKVQYTNSKQKTVRFLQLRHLTRAGLCIRETETPR